jgi:hypothetical protein
MNAAGASAFVLGIEYLSAPASRPGMYPPIPVLRRLGFRKSFEIEQERRDLKLLRGDYKSAAVGDAEAEEVLEAVQA